MKSAYFRRMAAALVCLVAGNACADDLSALGAIDINTLSVVSDPSSGNFMVIDSRMTETTTAAVFGGLIGAAVNSAVNADEDSDKADRYREAASRLQLASVLEKAIVETLTKRGVSLSQQGSHQLSVEVKDWGLTRISYHQPEATVFLKVRVVMRDGRKVVWDTHMKESGSKSALLADISDEDFSQQMVALTDKTGKRIAYEIIYR